MKTSVLATLILSLTLYLASAPPLLSAEASAEKKESASDSKKTVKKDAKDKKKAVVVASTYTLKKKLFEIKAELSGIFAAVKTARISIAPKRWSSLSVVSAIPHGSVVKKGDLLVQLETEKLEKEIGNAELNQPLAALTLKLAELELIELEKSTPLNLASRRRTKEYAQEALTYFEKTDRAQREKSAKEGLKQNSQYLSYAQEELDQLQKMYAADDLTEETEEIIITRAKNSVAAAKFRVESTKLSTERTLKNRLPRELQQLQDRAKSSAISWDKSSKTLPQELKKKKLEIEKMKRDQKQSADHLQEMKADLASFKVLAPHDGIVYFGAENRGKWSMASILEKKLTPGGKLMPHEVFMSVAQPQALQVQLSIPEKQLSLLKQGDAAKITATAKPDSPLKGELSELKFVPLPSGGFPGSMKILSDTQGLYPGMTCKVLFEIYKKPQTLTVPKKSVTTEKSESFVRLKGGKKQVVKTGRSDSKVIEILSGLKEGDIIQL